jgi:hypothetical protein
MKKYLILFSIILSFQEAKATLDISCSPLSLGTFLLDSGLTSANDSGFSRIGMAEFVGQEADCLITGDTESSVDVTINGDSTSLTLSGSSDSFGADVRIEDDSNTNLGTNTNFMIPTGSTTKSFKIDASVPSGQPPVSGGIFSSTIIINVSYN